MTPERAREIAQTCLESKWGPLLTGFPITRNGVIDKIAAAILAAVKPLEEEIERLRKQLSEVGEQIEADRTAVAVSMTAANKAVDGRHWLTEGRGPYEWNDDNWHAEFRAAAIEIKQALEPLTKIAANWKDCPQKAEDVARARIDLKRRADSAEARVKALEGALQRIASFGTYDEVNDSDQMAGNGEKACLIARAALSAPAQKETTNGNEA